MSEKRKVALGLSGGVDSSVCAQLLLEQGYDVTAVYLECYNVAGCRTDADRQDAFGVAKQLNIPFISLDFKAAYQQHVLDYFYAEYEAGRTPNPDVLCNREIKFGLFYDWAIGEGFDFIATGHYAKIITHPDNNSNHQQNLPSNKSNNKLSGAPDEQLRDSVPSLDKNTIGFSSSTPLNNSPNQLKHYGSLTLEPPFFTIPADTHKDQTYFLCQLKQEQLNNILFPLADLKKSEVRALAEKYHLFTAHKKDSTGVCFVGEFNLRDFLSQKIALTPGDVLDINGQIIGRHRGVAGYTLGQRHGFEIFNQSPATPTYYVIAKDVKNNTLTIGDKAATAQTSLHILDLHLINSEYSKTLSPPSFPSPWFSPSSILQSTTPASPSSASAAALVNSSTHPFQLFVRVRHTGDLVACALTKNPDNSYTATLADAVYGVGEGQFAVFYLKTASNTLCLGGGAIL